MPIEIREINIRTDITANNRERSGNVSQKDLEKLKQQLRNEYMQIISAKTKKTDYKR